MLYIELRITGDSSISIARFTRIGIDETYSPRFWYLFLTLLTYYDQLASLVRNHANLTELVHLRSRRVFPGPHLRIPCLLPSLIFYQSRKPRFRFNTMRLVPSAGSFLSSEQVM